ncbi:MAG: nucleotidyltransferase domain-containing protein [Elusimicrobiota bacterium]
MNLSKNQKNKLIKIAKKYGLKLIVAFGSAVSGKIHSDSDVDIAVLPKKDIRTHSFFSLISDLNAVFPEQEVDLSLINRANPLLLHKICFNPFLLYGKISDLNNLRIYSFKNYIDYQPFFKIEENYVNKFIQKYANR